MTVEFNETLLVRPTVREDRGMEMNFGSEYVANDELEYKLIFRKRRKSLR